MALLGELHFVPSGPTHGYDGRNNALRAQLTLSGSTCLALEELLTLLKGPVGSK
jgi:hypothetical protein